MVDLSIILITLLFSAFFSGIEIAFVSANKLLIELQNKQGLLPARIISRFMKYPSRFIGTMLVGNNIALVVYGIFMAKILKPIIEIVTTTEIPIFIIQTILATLFILVTAEFIPKTLFRVNPNRILNFFAIPALIIYYLFYPLVYLIIGLSKLTLKKIFNVKILEEKPVFGRVDLDNFIKESSSLKNEDDEIYPEIQIFRNALDFSKVKLRECMIPRTEIVALDANESIDVLKQNFIDTGLSKILIYKDDIDQITGYIHSYELFKQPINIDSILLPVSMVPETMAATELLKKLIKQQRSIAVVVDEFGGTAGIVTTEDVMEEIFGEIMDEHDVMNLIEKKINDKEYIFSGRLEIDYLNDKYNLNLPEHEEYETLSGLIIHHHESIPQFNKQIKIPIRNSEVTGTGIGFFVFTVTDVSETRIEVVNLKIEKFGDYKIGKFVSSPS
ncbi:MAG: hemolysin family protein [Bacteroidota bacterium]